MKLFFRETGEGCPLVILHGLYGSSDNWITFARNLGQYFKVYIPDQRNHGQSPHNDDHSYSALSDDLMQFLLENNINNPVVIGHSMGGKTAMFFAAKYPEKLRAMIILDISPGGYYENSQAPSGFLKHSDIVKYLMDLPLNKFNSREDADKELGKSIKPERIRLFLLKNITRDNSGNFAWKLNLRALKDNLDNILSGIDPNIIKPPKIPILFIRGALSGYINEDAINLINDLYPMSEIKTIEGAGHWIHAEKPDELFALILDFLKSHHLCS